MSGLTGFLIVLATTTASNEAIGISDIILAIFFGLIVAGVYYLSDRPNPFFKDDDKE